MATLLEEYLEATDSFQRATGTLGSVFDRVLSEEELLAVADLNAIGADLA